MYLVFMLGLAVLFIPVIYNIIIPLITDPTLAIIAQAAVGIVFLVLMIVVPISMATSD